MISFTRPGQYVFVTQYYRPSQRSESLQIYLRSTKGHTRGTFYLNDCKYRFGCRQVAVDSSGKVKVFNVDEPPSRMAVTLLSKADSPVAIVSSVEF